MNPRKRRGVIYMLLAVVLAAVTLILVTQYTSSVSSQVGPQVTVYRAKGDIPAYTPLGDENLEAVQVPRRWVSSSALVDRKEISGRRIGFNVQRGTMVSQDMLLAPSDLDRTEREIAINVDPVTGLAGRVRPGDRVDIYAVFADVPGLPKSVKILTRNVRVVSIAGQQTVTESTKQGVSEQQKVPVTLALSTGDSQAVAYASAFAEEVRLVALPTDVGTDRTGEKGNYDAKDLGGEAIPERGTP